MNIVIIQENGRHPESVQYRECNCLARELRECGHEVTCWGPGHAAYATPWADVYEWATDIVVCEQYDEAGWVPVIDHDVTKFVTYWAIDAHCALDHERSLASRVSADVILCAVLPAVDSWDDIAPCIWWPNAYPSDLMEGNGAREAKVAGVGFCGTLGPPKRQDALKAMQDALGMKLDVMVLGDAMRKAIAGYRVGYNMNIGSDINYRTFETMGIGTMLLTNDTPGLDRIFDIGVDLVCYTDTADAINQARYYLEHDHERVEIAERGYEIAMMRHGYDTRARHLCDVLQTKGDVRPYG